MRPFLLLIVLVISILFLWSVGKEDKNQNQKVISLFSPTPLPAFTPPKIKLTENKLQEIDAEGNLLWEVKSEEMAISSENEIFLKNISGEFYENKIPKVKFSAQNLVFYKLTRDLFFPDNFSAWSEKNNFTLRGRKIKWDNEKRKLYAQSRSEITKENIKITANYLEIDIKRELARAKGDTRTEVIIQ